MKRVCFFCADMSNSGGTERVTAAIASGLSELDGGALYRVSVLSLANPESRSFFSLGPKVALDTLFRRPVHGRRDLFSGIKRLRRYLKANQIDVLVAVDVILGLYALPAAAFGPARVLCWEHFHFDANLGSRSRDISRRLAARFAAGIVTLTEGDAKTYQSRLSPRCPVDAIGNPVPSPKNAVYDAGSRLILSAGRFTAQKGFDLLAQVAQKVLPGRPEWRWAVLGDGEDRDAVAAQLKAWGLQDRVLLPGRVTDVDDWYRKSGLFVLTSRFEGLPMALIEAKSYRLPIVSFRCPTGPEEIVQDGENGFLCSCFDLEEMTEKIGRLLDDESLRREFSDGSVLGMERFDLRYILQKWQTVLSRPARGRGAFSMTDGSGEKTAGSDGNFPEKGGGKA